MYRLKPGRRKENFFGRRKENPRQTWKTYCWLKLHTRMGPSVSILFVYSASRNVGKGMREKVYFFGNLR
jgi:hypothetical protein